MFHKVSIVKYFANLNYPLSLRREEIRRFVKSNNTFHTSIPTHVQGGSLIAKVLKNAECLNHLSLSAYDAANTNGNSLPPSFLDVESVFEIYLDFTGLRSLLED